jgi:hypothetical protein
MCFKTCLELCEVFRKAISHKVRPRCIEREHLKPKIPVVYTGGDILLTGVRDV